MNAPLAVMTTSSAPQGPGPRLTSLSHGGGCGCKIAPGVLAELMQGSLPGRRYADLMVGTDTSDDAAVYRLNETQAIVATTDFFMPIVDDPFDFGRIGATNALSHIYGMGGRRIARRSGRHAHCRRPQYRFGRADLWAQRHGRG